MDQMLRSLPSPDQACVKFVNHTSKYVDIIWFNFTGEMVRFAILAPNQYLDINTFSQHPWKSYDRSTGLDLLVNGKTVFYPVSLREIHQQLQFVRVAQRSLSCRRSEVIISAPTDTLYRLCQQRVLQFISTLTQVDALLVPQIVKNDLRKLFGVRSEYMSKVVNLQQ